MTLRKKILIGFGAAFALFVLLNALFGKDDFASLDLQGSIKTSTGGNLVSSNILSDPYVFDDSQERLEQINCPSKFPKNWRYADENTSPDRNGDFRMWFTSFSDKKLVISRAESSDGFVWSNISEGVLKPEKEGWDKLGVETAFVLKGPDEKYRMYYTVSLKENEDFVIGLALSQDGANWQKLGQPVLRAQNDWERMGVMEPSVIYDAKEEIYKMWYAGLGEKDGKLANRIGYATSKDGINWNRRPESVLDVGTEGAWDDVLVSHVNVVRSSEGYHMFYFGVEGWDDEGAMQRGAIGHAYSQDGTSWQKNPDNPIVKPRAGHWDAWTIGGPSAIIKDGEILLWYFGNPRKDSFEGRIGLLKGSCK